MWKRFLIFTSQVCWIPWNHKYILHETAYGTFLLLKNSLIYFPSLFCLHSSSTIILHVYSIETLFIISAVRDSSWRLLFQGKRISIMPYTYSIIGHGRCVIINQNPYTFLTDSFIYYIYEREIEFCTKSETTRTHGYSQP